MTTTPANGPVLEIVDPTTLTVDRNIRADLHLDKAFIGSVKENGILVPITAVRDRDGTLRVRAGHRRTAAAIHAGLTEVPVVITAAEDDTDPGHAARIIGQIVENRHRTALTDADTVTAVEQLAAFGVSIASIARKTKLAKADVEHAAAIATSTAASDALADTDLGLTLEEAAWLAEFDDDTEAQEAILETLTTPWRRRDARHRVQRIRDHRAEAAARAIIAAALTGQGLTVVDAPTWSDPTPVPLHKLSDTQPTPAKPTQPAVDPTAHADTCAGHVVWLDTRGRVSAPRSESRHDEFQREAHLARNDDDPDDATAEHDGGPGCDHVADGFGFDTVPGCATPHLHHERWLPFSGQQRHQAGTDEAKAERRRIIALNKAGDAAKVVRTEWLSTFSQRKTSPKDAPQFLLAAVTAGDLPLTDLLSKGRHALTGTAGVSLAGAATASPARAAHLVLCSVLWAYEEHTGRDLWRGPQPWRDRYLDTLAAWGYPLAEVERVATGDLTDQAAYDAITTG